MIDPFQQPPHSDKLSSSRKRRKENENKTKWTNKNLIWTMIFSYLFFCFVYFLIIVHRKITGGLCFEKQIKMIINRREEKAYTPCITKFYYLISTTFYAIIGVRFSNNSFLWAYFQKKVINSLNENENLCITNCCGQILICFSGSSSL